jgi:hypothetical protein
MANKGATLMMRNRRQERDLRDWGGMKGRVDRWLTSA